MEEREVIRLFLDKGFQVSKDALSLIIQNPEVVLDGLNILEPRPFIISSEHVKRIFREQDIRKSGEPEIKLISTFDFDISPVSVDDYFKKISSIFENIKSQLTENKELDKLISINKISLKTSEFSTIGMVREKKGNHIILEDLTGEVSIYFDTSLMQKYGEIELDDVIGIKCRKIDAKFNALQVIFPDIPIKREIKKSKKQINLIFLPETTDFNTYINIEKELDFKNVFTLIYSFSKLPPNITQKFKEVGDRDKISLFDIDGIKLMIIPKELFDKTVSSISIFDFLKKKMIAGLKSIIMKNLFIEYVPDIIFSNLEPSIYKNYKGTTVISNPSMKEVFIIDLKTREVLQKQIL